MLEKLILVISESLVLIVEFVSGKTEVEKLS